MRDNMFPIIQKISPKYCGEDCVQLMFTYDKAFCVIKKNEEANELMFYHNKLKSNSNIKYTNKYVTDERRKQFPYSNIPLHKIKKWFKTRNVVNQLLDYDSIYVIIRGDENNTLTLFCKVLKDGDSAIVVQDIKMASIFEMNVDELKHLVFQETLEPNIRVSINGIITEEDINEGKKMVKRK